MKFFIISVLFIVGFKLFVFLTGTEDDLKPMTHEELFPLDDINNPNSPNYLPYGDDDLFQ